MATLKGGMVERCRCGADDCKRCHGENFIGDTYIPPDATEEVYDEAKKEVVRDILWWDDNA